jgi:chromate transporter
VRSPDRLDNGGEGAAGPAAALEVIRVFLGLGLTSFGGPIAHLGYFRQAFVERRGWLSEARYAELVALCQFLPGPTSSQVAYALGLMRAGPLGGLAAWVGFTGPSALLMLGFAYAQPGLSGSGVGAAAVHGLKLAAVAVVARALVAMGRSLSPDLPRILIAAAAGAIVVAGPAALGESLAIVTGALAGLVLCGAPPRDDRPPRPRRPPGLYGPALLATAFVMLFLPGVAIGPDAPALALFHAFYRAGALVFGGGHVVLPLLRDQMAANRWVGDDVFLAGYGAAQALPGPLFSFAAFLGAVAKPVGGPAGAAIALAAIFLPGLLLVSALAPYGPVLRRSPVAAAAIRGANAAVVGVLAIAFYDPVVTSGIGSIADTLIAGLAFGILIRPRTPALAAVVLCVAGAILVALLGLGA